MASFNSLFLVALGLCATRLAQGQLFTLSCAPLEIASLDPIVSPGGLSGHVHAIVGGNGMNMTMTEDTATTFGNDTTCQRTIDQSNYWEEALYYWNKDDTFTVMEFQGAAIYYLNRACDYVEGQTSCPDNFNASAPPAGLRMLAGDPTRRTFNASSFADQAMQHVCLTNTDAPNYNGLPQQPCQRLRSEVFHASCWDGVNLDSPDHQSHVAYPIDNYNGGRCPKSHPKAIYSVFFEFFWNTEPYPDYTRWVYSTGDQTGMSLHGDVLFGWTNMTALEEAISTCQGPDGFFADTCSVNIPSQIGPGAAIPPLIPPPAQNVTGPLLALPGNNPVSGNGSNPVTGKSTMTGSSTATGNNAVPSVTFAPAAVSSSVSSANHVVSTPSSGSSSVSTASHVVSTLSASSIGAIVAPSTMTGVSASEVTTAGLTAPDPPVSSCVFSTSIIMATVTVTVTTSAGTSPATSTSVPASWSYKGCFSDNLNARVLTGITLANIGNQVTNTRCVAYCESAGFSLAGTEFADQCFCGNELTGSSSLDETKCNMSCEGDSNQTCGGSLALSVYFNSATTKRHQRIRGFSN